MSVEREDGIFALSDELLREALRRKSVNKVVVSVCIPCRNEADTIAPIVATILSELMVGSSVSSSALSCGWVDELLVFDDGSTDDTAALARAAGATVVDVAAITSQLDPSLTPGSGKGNVLWVSVAASAGDIVVWCDGDLTSFTPSYVQRLVAPMLLDLSVEMVKGYYERPVDRDHEGGGRNTELVAKPLLALLYPSLRNVKQPLAGEYAARRTLLERIPFVQDYGVEIAMLIDVADLVGNAGIVQVDLGVRRHRHRSLAELSVQSVQIMRAVFRRTGVRSDAHESVVSPFSDLPERPPLATVPGYRAGLSRQA